ncbi:hypothetical protein MKX42_23685 [Paenibacillus sp. FSL R7-0204]|uniref:hypothetical protein n=1 Tax=Paenibacillus sp. FSL R7-0204 TaxID=2921675 RepID=UPI0030F6AB8C
MDSQIKTTQKNKRRRGRTEEYPVEMLKQLALEVKEKSNGAKLTNLKLEKETGIGRNTWSRKLSDFIDELNSPVMGYRKLNNEDDVYLPSIASIIEAYGDNKSELMNKLMDVEQLYQKLYGDLVEREREVKDYQKLKEEVTKLRLDVQKYKKQAFHYEALYKQFVLSSTFEHLRNEQGISENVIAFEKNVPENTKLKNLKSFFPNNNELSLPNVNSEKGNANLDFLKNIAPDLLDDE